MPKILEQSESESPSEVHQTGPANGESKTARKEVSGGRPGVNFASGLLENSNLKQPRKFVDFLIALAGQTAFVILLILLPLCYTQAFNPPEFERMMLIVPPPPPPPPPPLVREIVKPKASLFQNGKLFAPRTVPKHIEIVKEAPEETPDLPESPEEYLGECRAEHWEECAEASFPLEISQSHRRPRRAGAGRVRRRGGAGTIPAKKLLESAVEIPADLARRSAVCR